MKAAIPLIVIVTLSATAVHAGFFDNLAASVSDKFNQATVWAQNQAAPALSQGFSDAKTWVTDSAVPAVQSGVNAAMDSENHQAAADWIKNKAAAVETKAKKAYHAIASDEDEEAATRE